jgi:signal transduction histidine kinase
MAALVINAKGEIVAENSESADLLAPFDRGDTVPLTVDAAVARVQRTRLSEVVELHLPGSEERLQISVSAIGTAGTADSSFALITILRPEQAPARTQAYQQLVSALGHELRTPLTAIMGHTEIMGSCQIEEEALWRRSLDFVTAEVERLSRLVEDLLYLSRLDLAPPYLRPANLRLVAEEAISTVFDSAEDHKVSLVLQASGRLPRVLADPDRIRQVFLNLLDNAIKYAPDSTVTVRLEPTEEAIKVEVSDNGPGVELDDLDHLFKPLYRGRHHKATPGTGMGLAIVRSILDQHKAAIHVDSEPDRGTRFTFSLPLAAA